MRLAVRLGLISTLALSPCLTTCARAQPPGPPAARTAGPLADSLRAFVLRMVDGMRRLDAEGTIALYGDTARFVHVEDGTVIPWPDLARSMRRFFATATSNPLEVLGEPGVTILDERSAAVWVVHRAGAHDGRPAHEGVWTGVLRRFPEGWRIVHSHSSDR